MDKWNLIINVELCENCNNCVLSSKDEFIGNEFAGYSAPAQLENSEFITITRKTRGQAPVVDTSYLIQMCNHCDNAPCMKVGGDAVYKRNDGIVIIDPIKAKGRKDIMESCPYGSIVWNEELELPQTWFFDAHLLDQGWSKPRCAQACPTGVFEPIKISDKKMQKRAAEEHLEVLLPNLNTKPRVFYRNLYRFSKCFVGGTVVTDIAGVEECVQEAEVALFQAGNHLGATQTDVFGEFKFDKLEPNSGDYTLIVEHPKLGAAEATTKLRQSQYIGVIKIKKATIKKPE